MENEEQNQHVEEENQVQEPVEEQPSEAEETVEKTSEEALETEEVAEAESDDEDNSLPFPRARVVNIMKTQIKDKQIRSEVKEAMNLWLGNLLKKLAKEMDATMYGSIGIADFQRATKPYDMIEDIIHEEERLMTSLDKLKLDCDSISRELQRFFVTIKGKKNDNDV